MRDSSPRTTQDIAGVHLFGGPGLNLDAERQSVLDLLARHGLDAVVEVAQDGDADGRTVEFRLNVASTREWAPDYDTTGLVRTLALDTRGRTVDLEREILIAMLCSPVPFAFSGYAELASAMRIRRNIVQAGRETVLAFDTEEAERPEDDWTYTEASGFTVRAGRSLITALQKATQPGCGRRYSFSCYRATEYVILLGLAQELAQHNPALLEALQRQWESRAIMSGEFHDVFLHEYGSLAHPLPFKYYVPGDRVWFRNPDEPSACVEGYEGSWVVYLGEGLFTNFWKPGEPYTLHGKCVELYHWRHALCQDARGRPMIDEQIVEARVAASLRDPVEVAAILDLMMRVRDPSGVYLAGGCIDASRESVHQTIKIDPAGVC